MENMERADLQTQLLDKLGGWLDGIMAEVGALAQAAGDILKQLAPQAMPWPSLTRLQPALAQIRLLRQSPGAPPWQGPPYQFRPLRRIAGR